MANFRTLRVWNYIWDKLSSFATGGNYFVESPFGAAPLIIDEATIFYVDPVLGNDSNDGTAARPFKTVKASLDYLRNFTIAARVTIQLSAGTHDGFVVADLNFDGGAVPASVTIQGAFDLSTVATGTNSGVLSTFTGAGPSVLTDATQSWTVDNLKGKWVQVNANVNGTKPAGPSYFPISSNTATTITIPNLGALGTLANNNYTIVDPVSVIAQNKIYQSTVTGTQTVCVGVGSVGGLGQPVVLKGLKFAVTVVGGAGMRTFGSTSIRIEECQFDMTAANIGVVFGGLHYNVSTCQFKMTANNGTAVTVQNILIHTTGSTGGSLTGCYFWSPSLLSGTTAFIGQGLGRATVGGVFENLAAAIAFGGTSGSGSSANASISGAVFTNCTTAISMFSPLSLATVQSATGTGVTTFISASKGAKLQLFSSVAAFGTTEISVDGVTSTIAAMRANTPKIFPLTPNAYGGYVYE